MSFSGAAGAERKPNNLASLDNYISFEKFLKSKNFPPSPAGARSTPLNQPSAEENHTTAAMLRGNQPYPPASVFEAGTFPVWEGKC